MERGGVVDEPGQGELRLVAQHQRQPVRRQLVRVRRGGISARQRGGQTLSGHWHNDQAQRQYETAGWAVTPAVLLNWQFRQDDLPQFALAASSAVSADPVTGLNRIRQLPAPTRVLEAGDEECSDRCAVRHDRFFGARARCDRGSIARRLAKAASDIPVIGCDRLRRRCQTPSAGAAPSGRRAGR